nr:hypothetical protein [Tanacetum cinerariifolium]
SSNRIPSFCQLGLGGRGTWEVRVRCGSEFGTIGCRVSLRRLHPDAVAKVLTPSLVNPDSVIENPNAVSTFCKSIFKPSLYQSSPLPPFPSSLSSSFSIFMASTQASSYNVYEKINLIIIPPRQLFVDITNKDDTNFTPSPITTSSSPSPLNEPSKTPSTKDTYSTFGNTSSSFESKPKSSPHSLNEPLSPQPLNPFLYDMLDVPLRPSNPIPLQMYPSLDITLSLSPLTPLDHLLESPSPPSPQPPPPPP